MIDLEFDSDQLSIANSVAQFCADHCSADRVKQEVDRFPRELWGELANLGMLAIGTPEGGGGAIEMVAAMEALGAHVFPGPLVGTFLATQVVASEERQQVSEGAIVVSVGAAPLLPWAPVADRFIEVVGGQLFDARPASSIEEVPTLGGEPWGRVELVRGAAFANALSGLVIGDIAHAAYQSAAGRALIAAASEHAATRTQFGKPIGEFQAVAHPLADCSMDIEASRLLARNAAFCFDDAAGDKAGAARVVACGAKLSANRSALAAANVCHQVFGANGITLEGPVFHISRRIRQLASSPVKDPTSRNVIHDSIGMGGATKSSESEHGSATR